jgi:post-GPI attachment to proteins factor 3
MFIIIYSLFSIILINTVFASNGDRSSYFQNCLYELINKNCSDLEVFNKNQPFYLKLLLWDCVDETKYECMWSTVDFFIKSRFDVPQFYGKWPFTRMFGIQEPLSVIASLMHFIINFSMLKRIRKEISNEARLKKLWIGFAYMNLITWFWSSLFHSRDFSFTEKMDYYCAFGLVLYQVNAFFIRYFFYNNKISRKNRQIYSYLISFLFLSFFSYHIYYLHFIHFDYGYNMKVNIFFGLFNSICWLTSSINDYVYKNLEYCWRNILSILIIIVTTGLFEVPDFIPILWIADGHALWHLTTAIVPLFWYQFFIDDCKYHLRTNYDLTHLD